MEGPPVDVLHDFQSKVRPVYVGLLHRPVDVLHRPDRSELKAPPVDVLPRLYREANLPYTPSRSLLAQTSDEYYKVYRDKDVTENEVVSLLGDYHKNVVCIEHEENIATTIYYPNAIYESRIYSELLRIAKGEIAYRLKQDTSEVDDDSFSWWMEEGLNGKLKLLPDIRLVYNIYKRRLSLIKISPKYASEKTIEHFERLLKLTDTVNLRYLMLSAQCIALTLKYPIWDEKIDIVEANAVMLTAITEWLAKL